MEKFLKGEGNKQKLAFISKFTKQNKRGGRNFCDGEKSWKSISEIKIFRNIGKKFYNFYKIDFMIQICSQLYCQFWCKFSALIFISHLVPLYWKWKLFSSRIIFSKTSKVSGFFKLLHSLKLICVAINISMLHWNIHTKSCLWKRKQESWKTSPPQKYR